MARRIILWPLLALIAAFLAVLAWSSPAIRSFGYEYEADLGLPEKLTSPQEILDWMRKNIRYQTDTTSHQRDYWQTPEETVNRRAGDCEDFSLLFMYLCRRYLDIEPRLFVVSRNSIGTYDHTIVEVDGSWYDPAVGCRIQRGTPYHVFYDFSYSRSLWMAQRYHAGVIQTMRPEWTR